MQLPADSQEVFGSAIRSPDKSTPIGLVDRPNGGIAALFNVYRNNHVIGLSEALSKTFPVVQQLVGEKFFRLAAVEYVRKYPPTSPVLLLYGDQFADFLTTLPGITRVAYVADIARLEWSRVFSLNAADASPVPVQALTDINPEMLRNVCFSMHPSLQLLSSNWPVLSIWRDCQEATDDKVNLSDAEQLMIVRSSFDVNSWLLSTGVYAFIHTLFTGGTLGEATEAAISVQKDFNLAEQMTLVFQRGAVIGVSPK